MAYVTIIILTYFMEMLISYSFFHKLVKEKCQMPDVCLLALFCLKVEH